MKGKVKAIKQPVDRLKGKGHHIDESVRLENYIDKLGSLTLKFDQNFKKILETTSEMIFATDTNGNLMFTNKSWSKHTGHSCDEAKVISIFDLAHSDDKEVIKERFIDVLKGNSHGDFEFKSKTKDGSHINVKINLLPMVGSEGNVVAVCGIGRDINESKKMEIALQESHEMYMSIVETAAKAGNGIIMVQNIGNAEGIIIFANEEAEKITGYAKEELTGKPFQYLFHPDIHTDMVNRYRRRQTGEEFSTYPELSLIRKNGTTVFVEYFTSNTTYRGNTALIVHFRDITKRKQIEEALSESQGIYKSMVDTADRANIGIGIVQNVGNKKGIVVFANNELLRIVGYTKEEFIGSAFQDILITDSLSDFMDLYQKRQAGEELKGYSELWVRRKDGTKVPIECNAGIATYQNKVATIAYIRDIADSKRAEEVLQRNKEHYQALIENSFDTIIVLDSDGRVRYINPSVKRPFGYELGRMISKSVFDFIHPDNMPYAMDAFKEGIQIPGYSTCLELKVQREDGSWLDVECIASNLLAHPAIEGIVVNLRDITERKQAEEKLRESEQRFRAIFDNALDGICLADAETRELYTCNNVFCNMLGYSLEEMMKMEVTDIHPEEDLPNVLEQFNKQIKGDFTLAKDIPVQRKDGSIFYSDVNASLLTIGGREYLMGIFRDITERKQMEEKYKQLLEDMKDGYVVVQGDYIVFANRRFAEIYGYEPEQLILPKVTQFIAPEDLQEVLGLYMKVIKGEEEAPDRLELMGMKRDGTTFPIQAGARPIEYEGKSAYSVIIRDLTERKYINDMLKESQEKLQSILQALPDILSHLSHDGTFMDEPMGQYELSAQYPSTFLMKNLYDVFPNDFADRALTTIKKALNDGIPQVMEHKLPIPLRTNEEDIYETRIVPFRRDEVLAISRNITNRKLAEKRLHTYQQQLKYLTSQLSQTEELERRRLAVDLHDLIGQSLAVIKMKLNAWKDTLYTTGHASSMKEVMELLEGTINNTRSLTFDLSPPVLYELGLEAALEFLLEQFQERYALQYEFKDDNQKKPLEDEVRILLYRCVSELLMNVIKHSKAQLVKLSICRVNRQISITLDDDGVGFSIQDIEMEGETQRFGLFSIKERLNWIGGSFKLESNLGCGTNITLKAPLNYN